METRLLDGQSGIQFLIFLFFYFFIVDVLAFILFLVVFRRDLCTWACQSLCPDVMHDTHADVHGYLIYSILFQLLIL